jgi:hypothetical protein
VTPLAAGTADGVTVSRLLVAALAASALVLGPPANAGTSSCGTSGYAYAGVGSSARAYGIATRLTATTAPQVLNGHVAGWVGVGGPGQGPNRTDEWLQVGFSAFPDSSTSSLYYELAQPHQAPAYHELETGLPAGTKRKVAVAELAGRPGWWRVWVDDKAVAGPVYLPGSHGAWRPLATTETWGAGAQVCNRFRYRFDGVSVASRPGGGWQRLGRHYTFQDHGYRIKPLGAARFIAGLV